MEWPSLARLFTFDASASIVF